MVGAIISNVEDFEEFREDEIEFTGRTSDPDLAAKVFGIICDDNDQNSLSYSPSPNKKSTCDDTIDSFSDSALKLSFQEPADKENIVLTSSGNNEKPPSQCEADKKKNKRSKPPVSKKAFADKKFRAPLQNHGLKHTTFSINESLNAVKQARLGAFEQKKAETAHIKEVRLKARNEIEKLNAEAEKVKQDLLQVRSHLSTEFSRARREKKEKIRIAKREEITQESLFKSKVHREHNKKQRDNELRRKRESVLTRKKIRINHREGEEKMKLLRVSEDSAYFDERKASSKAQETVKKESMSRKRQSLAFRNKHASSIRELDSMLEHKHIREEEESYELKVSGEKDAKAYKRELEEDRRKSFAFRNEEASKQRALSKEIQDNELQERHASFELNLADEKDAKNYKHQLEEERRQSFAFRNAEGLKHRVLTKQMEKEVLQKDHESYELKWAGEKDTEDYKEIIKEGRRESFVYRNAEASAQRALSQKMKSDEMEKSHNSIELKWAGEKDVEAYECQMREERRNSFEFRNAEASEQRTFLRKIQKEESQEIHESFELKWAGEKDVEVYKRQMEEERRVSFEFRNAEASEQRALLQKIRNDESQETHELFELKWAGEKDAGDHKRYLEEKRRESLQGRNTAASEQRIISQQMQEIALQDSHNSLELKWAGDKDADAYRCQMKEERRQSLAFRNAEASEHEEFSQKRQADAMEDSHKSFNLKWEGEKDVEKYNRQKEEGRRQSLAFRNAEASRQRAILQKIQKDEMEESHDSFELKWAGEKDVEAYKSKMDNERRESLALRNSEASKQRAHLLKVHADEMQESHDSLELKWAGEKDAEVYKRDMEEDRRQSFQLRSAEASEQRAISQQIQNQELQENHDSFELKWAGEKDAEAYKKLMEEQKRQSLSFRNAEASIQRTLSSIMKDDELEESHNSYEMKWSGEKDAEVYKFQLQEERRQSFANRNAEASRQRVLSQHMQNNALKDEHESNELKWAGERDAEMYNRQLDEQKRLSLQYSNAEGVKHRLLMNELLSLAKEEEAESFILKWAGEDDAKKHLENEALKRRILLKLQNNEAKKHREMEKEKHDSLIMEKVKEGSLQSLCARDVENYKSDCEARKRESLQLRKNEVILQKLQTEVDQLKLKELDDKNNFLEHAANQDVVKYIKKCKQRSRKSLAFRAKEKRLHSKIDKANREEEREKREQDSLFTSLDAKYVQLAKDKERAQASLETLKHRSCTFSTNPFSALLD